MAVAQQVTCWSATKFCAAGYCHSLRQITCKIWYNWLSILFRYVWHSLWIVQFQHKSYVPLEFTHVSWVLTWHSCCLEHLFLTVTYMYNTVSVCSLAVSGLFNWQWGGGFGKSTTHHARFAISFCSFWNLLVNIWTFHVEEKYM